MQICNDIRGSNFAGQCIFSFGVYMLVLMWSKELFARTMTMEDAYQVQITLQLHAPICDSSLYSTARGTHWIHV